MKSRPLAPIASSSGDAEQPLGGAVGPAHPRGGVDHEHRVGQRQGDGRERGEIVRVRGVLQPSAFEPTPSLAIASASSAPERRPLEEPIGRRSEVIVNAFVRKITSPTTETRPGSPYPTVLAQAAGNFWFPRRDERLPLELGGDRVPGEDVRP